MSLLLLLRRDLFARTSETVMESNKAGKLFVVGIGPGGPEHLTPAAAQALESADTVVGYQTYLDLVTPLLASKEVVSSGMRQEVDRCREAIALAAAGKIVALVSGGDAGVYGMAGLVLELVADGGPEVEIVPAVSAVQAAAARLGAPLMHDFAVISLSDLLTPWPLIRQRLEAAASADFVIALYNPRSKGRPDHLDAARKIILRHRSSQTPVGIVRHATRAGESIAVGELATFSVDEIDMFSLVIIGNSQSLVDRAGRMVTPRGYDPKSKGKGVREKGKGLNLDPLTFGLSPAKALFIGGTGSDVGKSIVTAGLCRLFKKRGLSVAPFKAQNMALNSAVTPEGGEIGRAQALQATACGLEPHVDMNPVLLKPNSDTGSQVVVLGRPRGNKTVAEYHACKQELFSEVEAAYQRLAAKHELILLEGAGSIAEINLKQHDITNLKAAAMADAPILLIADIDRGGVFASLVGTLELLSPAERANVKGLIINRFRGDPELLADGLRQIEDRTGVPVVGVIPWIKLNLPEEDSVALDRKGLPTKTDALRIGVVRLPRISNYTDFDTLAAEPDVELHYLVSPEQVADCDLLVLPGTKSSLDDLAWLGESGFAEAIRTFHADGKRVVGVCGGFQMLGRKLADPDRVESGRKEANGLGLLDVETTMMTGKQTHRVVAEMLQDNPVSALTIQGALSGYEIHMGETVCGPLAHTLFRLTHRSGLPVDIADGAVSPDGKVWGTYLHGLFDNAELRRRLIDTLWSDLGRVRKAAPLQLSVEDELDRLAAHLEENLDVQKIFALIEFAG